MWDEKTFKLLSNLDVPSHMLNRSKIGYNELWKPIKILLEQQTIPKKGWTDIQIKYLLNFLNSLDSDKDPKAIRIGEREGRISTPLLKELSGNFCHGVGRSGNLTAAQPKAAGASLMQNLTNKITLALINELGLPNIKGAITLPMGTGMGLANTLRGCFSFYNTPLSHQPNVLMTQIDHKSPLKGVEFIGANAIIIPGKSGKNHHANEGIYVSIEDIEKIYQQNKGKVVAIISNSCFFAPRVPDDIKSIAKFAKEKKLIHIVNNAYGIQSHLLLKILRSAIDAGRVDAIIQSTDKCFLTPVGGSVVISPNEAIINQISQTYAGRASASPVLHLLVSLLSMGLDGYRKRMTDQQNNKLLLEELMEKLAKKYDEKLIDCKNPISCAMTLKNFSNNAINKLGGYLYNLRVTGPRVINPNVKNFGTSAKEGESIPPYLVMNAAIGVKKENIIHSVERLQQALEQLPK